MNALHNFLFDEYANATQQGLTEEAARAYLQDLQKIIALWDLGLRYAVSGNKEGVREALETALKEAEAMDRRKGFPKTESQPIVRAHELE